MGKLKRGWVVYDRVILVLWEKLSLWLRGVGSELVGTAFSLGNGDIVTILLV